MFIQIVIAVLTTVVVSATAFSLRIKNIKKNNKVLQEKFDKAAKEEDAFRDDFKFFLSCLAAKRDEAFYKEALRSNR